jgi:uncharacterized membrane protein
MKLRMDFPRKRKCFDGSMKIGKRSNRRTRSRVGLGKLSILALLALILASSGHVVLPARAATTCSSNQPCYYGYDSSGNYAWFPNPFPSYWQTSHNGQNVQVTTATITVSTQGFPSDYSSDLILDGRTVGSITGGGTAKFQIKGDDVHTFQVNSYVNGKSGERFYTKSSSWTSEKGKEVSVTTYQEQYGPLVFYGSGYYGTSSISSGNTTVDLHPRPRPHPSPIWFYYYPYYVPSTQTVIQPFDQSYTFAYETQYQLTVQNDFGGSVSESGWYVDGSSVNLNTDPMVQSSQDTRHVFVAWTLNGADMNTAQTTITMNQPYSAIAKYTKQYYVDVRSDYGNPSGSGWYDEGSKATIQVDKELPLDGLSGALGGKRVFDHWSGAGTASGANIAEISVDAPKLVAANWSVDMTWPYVIMVLLVSAIVVVILALFRPRIKRATTEAETKREAAEDGPATKAKEEAGQMEPLKILERRYASGEITREEYRRIKMDLVRGTEDKEVE